MNSDQHKATLNELHREIDRLKLQNKDQQWRLVLNGASSPTEILQETVSNQKQHNPKVGCILPSEIRRAIGAASSRAWLHIPSVVVGHQLR